MAKRITRKKIKETNEYEVEVKDNSPTSSTTSVKKTVKAANKTDAVRNATQGDPMDGDDEITIKKTGGGIAGATPSPNMESKGKPKKKRTRKPAIDPVTFEMIESIEYPYAIRLPVAFDRLMEQINIEYTRENNFINMLFAEPAHLIEFVSRLEKSKDNRSTVIVNGIMESMV